MFVTISASLDNIHDWSTLCSGELSTIFRAIKISNFYVENDVFLTWDTKAFTLQK